MQEQTKEIAYVFANLLAIGLAITGLLEFLLFDNFVYFKSLLITGGMLTLFSFLFFRANLNYENNEIESECDVVEKTE